MSGKAKSGTHFEAAIQVLTFFLEHTANSGTIYLKFHLQWGCSPKKKKKRVNTCFSATFSPNRNQTRVPCHIAFVYRDKRLNTVVLDMLAD